MENYFHMIWLIANPIQMNMWLRFSIGQIGGQINYKSKKERKQKNAINNASYCRLSFSSLFFFPLYFSWFAVWCYWSINGFRFYLASNVTVWWSRLHYIWKRIPYFFGSKKPFKHVNTVSNDILFSSEDNLKFISASIENNSYSDLHHFCSYRVANIQEHLRKKMECCTEEREKKKEHQTI